MYCNDEGTTTFVSLDVSEIYSGPLKTLVDKFDDCLGEYKLPSFYEVRISRINRQYISVAV